MKKIILVTFILCIAIKISAQSVPASLRQQSNRMEVDQHYNILKLAYAAMEKADYKGAIDYLTTAIEKSESVYYYYNRAICYDAVGKYKEALDDYNKTLTFDEMPESYYGIGRIEFKLDNFSEAIFYLKHALALSDKLLIDRAILPDKRVQIEKNKADIFLNLAASYKNMGDDSNAVTNFEKSNEAFSTLLKTDAKNYYYLYQRATGYSELSQAQHAIDDYSTIINLKIAGSGTGEAYYLRAKQYVLIENYNKAIEDFTKVLQADPGNTAVLFYCALCKLQLDKKDEACIDLKTAIKNGFKNSPDYKQLMADNPGSMEKFASCR